MTDIQNGKMIDPGKQSWNIKSGVFSSCMLHIIAMTCMLSDHMWATLFPYVDILTCIGRIAFPIFAFMIVEGFYHTSNFRRYLCRMLIFAVISEVPFDLVSGDSVLYLFHQNVLWTFLIGLLLIALIHKVRKTGKVWLWIPVAIVVTLVGYVIGTITMVDFYGAGVVMVIMFYLFRGKEPWKLIAQLVCMYYINAQLLSGYCYTFSIAGHNFEFPQQAFALIALPVIWLYNGKLGYHKKWFKYFCYAFYPGHLLVLYIIWQMVM